MARIVTLTVNPSVDVSMTVDHVHPDSKLRSGPVRREPGGGGLNVARAAGRLGGHVQAVWARGGLPGQLLGGLLDDEGVAHRPVDISADTRQSVIVFERGSERQFRFIPPGGPMTEADTSAVLDALADSCRQADYLVLSGSVPPGAGKDFYARAARRAGDHARVIVDASGEPLRHVVDVGAYVVKPNLRELGQAAGKELKSDADIRQAARSWTDRGVHAVVVSLGSAGAMLVTADSARHLRSPTVEIRSKVGAGDSMVAGLVTALADGKGLVEAVRYANVAGAAAVMTDGTQLCRPGDVDALLAQLHQQEDQAGNETSDASSR
jgi:6-phosphofructokinase 2